MAPQLDSHTSESRELLLNKAATLLSTRFGPVNREVRAHGKNVDLYFEYREFGEVRHVFVQTKNNRVRLSRNDVIKIWEEYIGLFASRRSTLLLLITKAGISTSAKEFIQNEVVEIRHQTIDELEGFVVETEGSAPLPVTSTGFTESVEVAPRARQNARLALAATGFFAVAFSLSLLHAIILYLEFPVIQVLGDTGDRVWGTVSLLLLVIAILTGAASVFDDEAAGERS